MGEGHVELGSSASTVDETSAVGFVATTANTDALVRAVLRATRHGYEPLVTYAGDEPPEGAVLAELLGATLVPTRVSKPDRERLVRVLVSAAQAASYDSLIVAPPECSPINYHRSQATLAETDATHCEAVTRTDARSQDNPSVLVAIPAYNEADTIGPVARAAASYADAVVVVDDGSDDGTASAAREAGADVIAHRRNRGYGGALKTAFAEAMERGARCLVILDGDGQHDPADIPVLVDRLTRPGANLVIGSRFLGDGESDAPLYRLLGMKAINLLTNLSMGVVSREARVSDTQSGFRAYGRAAIETLARDASIAEDMGASTDILHHAYRHDYEIAEVGTTVSYDVDNANSHDPVRHGLTLVSNIIQTVERQRPIMLLGIPGVACTILGFGLGYWSVIEYVSTKTFPVGVVIGTAFFGLLGLLACFTALILHSLTVHFSTELETDHR